MVEVNITLELIKQVFRFSVGLGIGVFLGIFLCLGVMMILWFIPNLKDKLRNYRFLSSIRKELPMVKIKCNQADCKYKNEDEECTNENIIINSQGECSSWEEKKIEIVD